MKQPADSHPYRPKPAPLPLERWSPLPHLVVVYLFVVGIVGPAGTCGRLLVNTLDSPDGDSSSVPWAIALLVAGLVIALGIGVRRRFAILAFGLGVALFAVSFPLGVARRVNGWRWSARCASGEGVACVEASVQTAGDESRRLLRHGCGLGNSESCFLMLRRDDAGPPEREYACGMLDRMCRGYLPNGYPELISAEQICQLKIAPCR